MEKKKGRFYCGTFSFSSRGCRACLQQAGRPSLDLTGWGLLCVPSCVLFDFFPSPLLRVRACGWCFCVSALVFRQGSGTKLGDIPIGELEHHTFLCRVYMYPFLSNITPSSFVVCVLFSAEHHTPLCRVCTLFWLLWSVPCCCCCCGCCYSAATAVAAAALYILACRLEKPHVPRAKLPQPLRATPCLVQRGSIFQCRRLCFRGIWGVRERVGLSASVTGTRRWTVEILSGRACFQSTRHM